MSETATTAGRALHSQPTFELHGRIAGNIVGLVSWPGPPDMHLSLVITDAYTGVTVIDGQPTYLEAGARNFLRITTNVSRQFPNNVKLRLPLAPPSGMTPQEFALRLFEQAQNFTSYVAAYSAPAKVRGSRMRPGQYNSSSYLAGLLRRVMGYVPYIDTPGYQVPGWESPMPAHFFKGEAIR